MLDYLKKLSAVLLHDNPLTSYILLILLVAFFTQLCQSDNHHCSPLGQHVLPLDKRMNKDETLIPELQDADSVKRFDYNRCRWRFEKNSRPQTGVQLVVQGLPLATEFSRCVNKAEIQIKSSLGWKKTIEAGSLHVFSLFKRQSLDIEAYWKANTPAVDRCAMKVRVLVPIQQDCSPDMLGFRGNCFALSTQKQNLTDAMSNIGGDAQLASFSSMAEVSEFIAANTARQHKYPHERPLSLGQPVRLGMFLNASAAEVLSLVRSDSSCQMQPVAKLSNFSATGIVTGPCLTLRVNKSDAAVIEFGDCSSPMLSLLSFPETARSVPSSAVHCSGSELATLLDRLQSRFADAESSPEFSAQGKNNSAREGNELFFQKNQDFIYPAIIVGALLLIAVFVVMAFAMKLRRCRKLKYLLNYEPQESKQLRVDHTQIAEPPKNFGNYADDYVAKRHPQADDITAPALHTSSSIDSLDLLAAANRPLLRQQEVPSSLSSTADLYLAARLAGDESSEDFSDLVPNSSDRFGHSDSESLSSSLLDSAVGGASAEPISNSQSASNVSRPKQTEQQQRNEKPDDSREDRSELPQVNNTKYLRRLYRQKIDQSGARHPQTPKIGCGSDMQRPFRQPKLEAREDPADSGEIEGQRLDRGELPPEGTTKQLRALFSN